MKAAVLHRPDHAPVYEDFADPIAADGEQIVAMLAAGLHPLTRSHARGDHYASRGGLPAIVGVDGVGARADGAPMYFGWLRHPYGTFAERAATRGGFALPAGLDPVRAAGMVNPAASSWLALTFRAPLTGGETVMIVGATGAAGQLAIQIANKLGAGRIVAVGRRADALAKLAVDAAVASTDGEALRAEISRGVDVILDYVWGPPARAVFDALLAVEPERRVRYVSIGAIAGDAAFRPDALRALPLELYGSGMGAVTRAQIMQSIPRILALLPELQLAIERVPLADIASAWQRDGGDRIVVVP